MAVYNGHQEDASGNLLLPTPHSLANVVELGSTASQAYTAGTYLVFNNRLCKATTAIARGNTLSIGRNLQEVTVGSQLSDLYQRVDHYLVGETIIWSDSTFYYTGITSGDGADLTVFIPLPRRVESARVITERNFTIGQIRGNGQYWTSSYIEILDCLLFQPNLLEIRVQLKNGAKFSPLTIYQMSIGGRFTMPNP